MRILCRVSFANPATSGELTNFYHVTKSVPFLYLSIVENWSIVVTSSDVVRLENGTQHIVPTSGGFIFVRCAVAESFVF